MRHTARTPRERDALTPRERQVLCLVGKGLTSADIGRTLGIAPRTVDRQAASAVARLGARNRRHAAFMVSENGGETVAGLRPDERELIGLLARGFTIDQAAQEMHYSRRTVARRVAGVRATLCVQTTAQALAALAVSQI